MAKNRNIIIANWKMNSSFDEAEQWIDNFKQKIADTKNLPKIVLCPPAILIDYIDETLLSHELDYLETQEKNIENLTENQIENLTNKIRKINLGAQDCSTEDLGAFTGDISAKMLVDAGCKYVILGHSERRKYQFESNELVSKKVTTALNNKLIPILCVGESLEARENNQYFDIIKEQIQNSLPKNTEIDHLIIAYEPVWSIGTGKIPTIEEIAQMAQFIKDTITQNQDCTIKNIQIIYGGSTNSKNTVQIMSAQNINGLLVGGASLKSEEFYQMALSCSSKKP